MTTIDLWDYNIDGQNKPELAKFKIAFFASMPKELIKGIPEPPEWEKVRKNKTLQDIPLLWRYCQGMLFLRYPHSIYLTDSRKQLVRR